MSCHICLTRTAPDLIKCKLCCDGLEQDACRECADVYADFRQFHDAGKSDRAFQLLKARRADGIAKEKEKAGGKMKRSIGYLALLVLSSCASFSTAPRMQVGQEVEVLREEFRGCRAVIEEHFGYDFQLRPEYYGLGPAKCPDGGEREITYFIHEEDLRLTGNGQPSGAEPAKKSGNRPYPGVFGGGK